MHSDVLRRGCHAALCHCTARLPRAASQRWASRTRDMLLSQPYLQFSHVLPFSSLHKSRSPLSQRALSTYRLLLRAAAPQGLDAAATAPPSSEQMQLHSRTRYNVQLVYRCRQYETDESRIQQWLTDADTIRSFLTHFHSLPPSIYADCFRQPNPQPKVHTSNTGASESPNAHDRNNVTAASLSARLRDLHTRTYIALIPLLTATASSTAEPRSVANVPASTGELASTTAITGPPPFPFPVALANYSSPWIDWLRSTRPVAFTISALEWLHSTTGSPWWLTLVLAGVVVRVALLPTVVYQQRVVHEISRLQPHFAYIRMLVSKSKLSYPRRLYETTRMRWALYWKYSCHPLKLLIPGVLQLSALVCVAVSLRPLLLVSPELKTGGFGWVMDLTQYDPYYVLPIAITALQYGFQYYIEKQTARRQAQRQSNHVGPAAALPVPLTGPAHADTPMGRLMAQFNYYRGGFIILLLPVIATLPSGLFVFQLTTLSYQLVQTAALDTVWVRRQLGLESAPRSIWKKREEATEEEVREFDRLQSAMRERIGNAASGPAMQEVPVKGEVISRTPSKPDVLFSSKSSAKREQQRKQRDVLLSKP